METNSNFPPSTVLHYDVLIVERYILPADFRSTLICPCSTCPSLRVTLVHYVLSKTSHFSLKRNIRLRYQYPRR